MLNSPLLQNCLGYIAGKWCSAQSGATLAVLDRATGEHLSDVPDMTAADTVAAVESAMAALRSPASLEQRRDWLLQIAAKLVENKSELAHIITRENGKPLKESTVEVDYSAGFFKYFADNIDHLKPHMLGDRIRNHTWTIHRRPAGVVGLITPWNFPLAMLAKKLAPALAAGCASITKPADLTPLSCVALWHLLDSIGLPAGIANLVIGRPAPIGDVLCSHPAVRLISFTGSTNVGKLLIEKTAPHVKRLALELGGNAPYVVMQNADPLAAAEALIPNKFRCGGQTCVCANRIYVHRDIEQAFADAISQRVAALRVGNGLEPTTDVGPLINRAAFEKVDRHVRDAIARGATRTVGNDPAKPSEDFAAFYPPTVLRNVNGAMLLSQEETFGPVVAIETFNTEQEAIEKANSTAYGLAAYLFTRDTDRATRMLAQLQFGHVAINSGTGPTPEAPFGGVKQSGIGREGGIDGMLEFTEAQTVAAL